MRRVQHPAITAARIGLFAVSSMLLLASPALSDGPRWRPVATPSPLVRDALLHNSLTKIEETSRLYAATASGSMPRCSSVFGVMAMTNNVDEWVVNPTARRISRR